MTRNNKSAAFGSLIKSERKQTQKYYLAVPEAINGSCRAVSQLDVKNRNILAAAQFAGQSVTAVLPQRRHPARRSRQGGSQIPHKQTNVTETLPQTYSGVFRAAS